MHRRHLIAALTAGILACVVSWALAAGNADDREIRQSYERYRQAYLRKDTNAVTSILSPKFTWRMPGGGTINRTQTIKTLREQMASIKSVQSMDIQIHKMTVQGDKAVVVVTETTKALLAGSGGKSQPALSKEHYRETWVKSASRWMLDRTEAVPATYR